MAKVSRCSICGQLKSQVRRRCDRACGRSDSYKALCRQYDKLPGEPIMCLICYLVKRQIAPRQFLHWQMCLSQTPAFLRFPSWGKRSKKMTVAEKRVWAERMQSEFLKYQMTPPVKK